MLSEIQKRIFELNYLGSSITAKDKFKPIEEAWRLRIEETCQPTSYESKLDDNRVFTLLRQSILKETEGKHPVVLLSGGVDSTLIAAILTKEKVEFECFSYVLSESDPTLTNIRYVEQQLGIKSKVIYYNQARVKSIWDSYFNYYDSPTMDYATLLMADFLTEVQTRVASKNTVLLDGIGADDIFGCSGLTRKNFYRAHLIYLLSHSTLKWHIFNHRKVDIYTLAVVQNRFAITLYQNYIFSRVLTSKMLEDAKQYIHTILLHLDNSVRNFYVGHSLMNLFYDGKRVAYKNAGLKTNALSIAYPYLDKEVMAYGLSIRNNLKVHPIIKQPLKSVLCGLGFQKSFVYGPKQGFIFDVFDVINIDCIIGYIGIVNNHFHLSKDCEDYIFKEYKNRNSAVDHFLFGLAMSQKLIPQLEGAK